jgi:photosystem II stability/assembly factor-like uncharacterized protein
MHRRYFVLFALFPAFFACHQETRPAGQTAIPTAQASVGSIKTASDIIYKSSDNGGTWQDVSAGLPAELWPGFVFVEGEDVFLGAENGLYQANIHTPVLQWRSDLSLNTNVNGMVRGASGLYVSSFGHGFFQEMMGAGVWAPVFQNLLVKTVNSILETSKNGILVSTDKGIYRSVDAGNSWKLVYESKYVGSMHQAGNAILASGLGGVMRSTDDGEHWENVLPNVDISREITVIGNSLAVITSYERDAAPWKDTPGEGTAHRLHLSDDDGKTWRTMENLLPPTGKIYDVKQSGKYLICSIESGVYRSADMGKTWEQVFKAAEFGYRLSVSGNVVFAILGVGC